MTKRSRTVIASDGLRARNNGSYAKAKLDWLQRYLIEGLKVAKQKQDRVYVDLFAGPGVSVDKHTGEEFESGALRAITLQSRAATGEPMTEAFLVNLDENDHRALTQRVERLNEEMRLRIPRSRIHLIHGDANVAVHQIMALIHPRAWVFVFADPEEAGQFPFSTVQALKSRGHSSVDLYTLFPLQLDIQRNLSYRPRRQIAFAAKLDAYFGTDLWRPVYEARQTSAQGREFRDQMEALYCRQLEVLWTKASCVARIKMGGERVLYHMIFAGTNEAALRLAGGVAQAEQRAANPDQGTLFGF